MTSGVYGVKSKAEELQEYIRDFSMDSKNQPTNCFPPSVEEFILLSCFYLCVTNEDLHGPVAVLINNVYNLLWASGVLSDAKQHKQRRYVPVKFCITRCRSLELDLFLSTLVDTTT